MQAIPGLACPACRGDLRQDRQSVRSCAACHRSYPVFEGIPSFVPSPSTDRSTLCQLTVLVPALNEAANLKELLPSIQRELQSLDIDHELIVVDGGSTDGTAEVVARHDAVLLPQAMPGYGGGRPARVAGAPGGGGPPPCVAGSAPAALPRPGGGGPRW